MTRTITAALLALALSTAVDTTAFDRRPPVFSSTGL